MSGNWGLNYQKNITKVIKADRVQNPVSLYVCLQGADLQYITIFEM